MEDENNKKGILAWFANNHVAANLLMMFIIIGGLITIVGIKMEIFPEMSLDIITVSVPYLGANPSDVEEGVCVRVEEAIAGTTGIKRMTSSAVEGSGTTVIEIEEYSDTEEVKDDIEAAVDRIITFPRETEKPVISELRTIHNTLSIVVYGDVSEKLLKKLVDEIRDELTAMENISQVQVSGVRPYEISIEVSEENLRKYGLSFEQVAMAVGMSSIDTPAGSVKTAGGTILLRTKGQRYTGEEFEDIVVLTRPDGTELKLSDIAAVKDEFEDNELYARFNGERAAQVNVFRTGEQNALDIANTVKELKTDKFFCPGSILGLEVDNTHPVAFGVPEEASAFFARSPAFKIIPSFTIDADVVAKYPGKNPLKSGWIIGEKSIFNKAAVVYIPYEKGHIVLIGFRVIQRAQSCGTFKILFNSLYLSASKMTQLP